MDTVLKNLEYLRQLSGNTQISYLDSIKSDLLKQVLAYTYDPHKLFKIDEGKYNKLDTSNIQALRSDFNHNDWISFITRLDYLSSIKSAKDEDVHKIISFINDFDSNYRDFMKKVLFKDLRLNMSIKKFQKVWPDFCVEPQVQLAQAKDNRADFANGLYSRKFDGKRVYILDGIPFSRSNKECSIPPMQHILNQLTESFEWSYLKDLVLDGECLYFEDGKENFQKGISLCQRDERAEGCENIYYVIFDIINKDNFLSKTTYIPFKDAYEILNGQKINKKKA